MDETLNKVGEDHDSQSQPQQTIFQEYNPIMSIYKDFIEVDG